MGQRLTKQFRSVSRLGDVCRDSQTPIAKPSRNRINFLGTPAADRDLCTKRNQLFRRRFTNTRAAARDEIGLTFHDVTSKSFLIGPQKPSRPSRATSSLAAAEFITVFSRQ
jgi:hypothetical protein